jgi:hypothetical protein
VTAECRAHRTPTDSDLGYPHGYTDMPDSLGGEYVREVKRGKPVEDWRWKPGRGFGRLWDWPEDHPKIQAMLLAFDPALPEWEVGFRVATWDDESMRLRAASPPKEKHVDDDASATDVEDAPGEHPPRAPLDPHLDAGGRGGERGPAEGVRGVLPADDRDAVADGEAAGRPAGPTQGVLL